MFYWNFRIWIIIFIIINGIYRKNVQVKLINNIKLYAKMPL